MSDPNNSKTPIMPCGPPTGEDGNPEQTRKQKQKRDPSNSPPNNSKATHRFFRTHMERNEQEPLKDVEEPHQEAISTTPNDGIRTVCTDVDLVKSYNEPGRSRSARASRKDRDEVNHGVYIAGTKKLETWRTKIRRLDCNAKFDDNNARKVFHSRCTRWLLVKEPGDTICFKEHLEVCQVKPIPAGGTLTGMGWLKKIEKDGGMEVEDKLRMPCHGVTVLENSLVDQYLNRTGTGGGGARSIHLVSKERFDTEFRFLTKGQMDEVYAAQRAEWVWRNDHLNLQVCATNCEKFTSSHSFATSLCPQCKSLLDLKAFIIAIHKKTPTDENAKYVNGRYIPTVLIGIYARVKGLKEIIEQRVSLRNFSIVTSTLLTAILEC